VILGITARGSGNQVISECSPFGYPVVTISDLCLWPATCEESRAQPSSAHRNCLPGTGGCPDKGGAGATESGGQGEFKSFDEIRDVSLVSFGLEYACLPIGEIAVSFVTYLCHDDWQRD
jgi:hypothetical protein